MSDDSIPLEPAATRLSLEFVKALPDHIKYPSTLIAVIYGLHHGEVMLEFQRVVSHLELGDAQDYWGLGWDGKECYMIPYDLFLNLLMTFDPHLMLKMFDVIGKGEMRKMLKETIGIDLEGITRS